MIRSSPLTPLTSTRATSPGRSVAGANDTRSGRCPCERAEASSTQTGESDAAAAAQKRREIISNLTISLPAAPSLPRRSACEASARRRAHCLQREAAMDNPKTSRREFCAHAISLSQWHLSSRDVAVKVTRQGPAAAVNVPQLSTVNGTPRAARSPSATSAARRSPMWEAPLSCRPAATAFSCYKRRRARSTPLRPFALTNSTSLPAFSPNTLRVPGSRLAVQHQRRRRAGPGDASAPRVHHAIYE